MFPLLYFSQPLISTQPGRSIRHGLGPAPIRSVPLLSLCTLDRDQQEQLLTHRSTTSLPTCDAVVLVQQRTPSTYLAYLDVSSSKIAA
jgi:hypothetical protein